MTEKKKFVVMDGITLATLAKVNEASAKMTREDRLRFLAQLTDLLEEQIDDLNNTATRRR